MELDLADDAVYSGCGGARRVVLDSHLDQLRLLFVTQERRLLFPAIAKFAVGVSIELRGAHFLWIPDLSQKDPYFITPVLMGISMFAMQTLTPTGADPAQRRMMMIMPLMLMGMFLWAPAGLNLYWLASNLCSLVQQAVTLAILRSREGAPARERRRR